MSRPAKGTLCPGWTEDGGTPCLGQMDQRRVPDGQTNTMSWTDRATPCPGRTAEPRVLDRRVRFTIVVYCSGSLWIFQACCGFSGLLRPFSFHGHLAVCLLQISIFLVLTPTLFLSSLLCAKYKYHSCCVELFARCQVSPAR